MKQVSCRLGIDHPKDAACVCDDERNGGLCILGVLPLIRGPEERTSQPMGPWPLLATVMLMKEAQGVNGEASLLPAC